MNDQDDGKRRMHLKNRKTRNEIDASSSFSVLLLVFDWHILSEEGAAAISSVRHFAFHCSLWEQFFY
jgi:hypothetical protein